MARGPWWFCLVLAASQFPPVAHNERPTGSSSRMAGSSAMSTVPGAWLRSGGFPHTRHNRACSSTSAPQFWQYIQLPTACLGVIRARQLHESRCNRSHNVLTAQGGYKQPARPTCCRNVRRSATRLRTLRCGRSPLSASPCWRQTRCARSLRRRRRNRSRRLRKQRSRPRRRRRRLEIGRPVEPDRRRRCAEQIAGPQGVEMSVAL